MGVLDQDTAFGQLQADLLAGADARVDVDTRPQSQAAHREHAVADEGAQPRVQVLAEFG